jgi:hypothetical protein
MECDTVLLGEWFPTFQRIKWRNWPLRMKAGYSFEMTSCEMWGESVMSNHVIMTFSSKQCTTLSKCTYLFHHWQFCSWTGSCYHHVEYHPQSLCWCQGYHNQCSLQNASEVPLVVSWVSPECVSLGGWLFLCWLLAQHCHWLMCHMQTM